MKIHAEHWTFIPNTERWTFMLDLRRSRWTATVTNEYRIEIKQSRRLVFTVNVYIICRYADSVFISNGVFNEKILSNNVEHRHADKKTKTRLRPRFLFRHNKEVHFLSRLRMLQDDNWYPFSFNSFIRILHILEVEQLTLNTKTQPWKKKIGRRNTAFCLFFEKHNMKTSTTALGETEFPRFSKTEQFSKRSSTSSFIVIPHTHTVKLRKYHDGGVKHNRLGKALLFVFVFFLKSNMWSFFGRVHFSRHVCWC